MGIDRAERLREEGYERVAVRTVALQHQVWKLDMELAEARELTLAERSVLGLIAGGIQQPQRMAELLGLEEGVIVPDVLVKLLREGLLRHVEALEISELGRRKLAGELVREPRKYTDVMVRYDPFQDEFRWEFDEPEVLKSSELRHEGTRALPPPHELKPLEVETRHSELQKLIDDYGLPFEPQQKGKPPARDILQLKATHAFPAWRRAQLEVWHHPGRDDWDWRLLYRGGEVRSISEALRQMAAEGVDIIPLDREPPAVELSAAGERVHAVVEATRDTPRARVLMGAEHREAMREAIEVARKELIIVSPWLRTDAVDQELIGWLSTALDRHTGLRVIIGYGIEKDDGSDTSRKARDQRQALSKLNLLGHRKRGRLRTVEIGNTHEKVIIVDSRYAVVTSFNFLSFNPKPGRGVRRETGTVVDDKELVKQLRESLVQELGLK